jgi:Predicted membrane protein (DUF2306)
VFHKISISQIILYLSLTAFTLAALFFSGVMATKILPYLHFERAINFLGTKPDEVLDKSHFMVAFYIHITSSMVVIVAGISQFWPQIVRRWPRWHRRLGVCYILGILVLAAPSGLVIAFYANGGLAARTGFILQCIVWWLVTLAAWWEIRQQRWQVHTEMMIRSFAITLAAMSLRTESYILFYGFGTKPIETYLTVTWLSWVGNWLLAELLIYFGLGKILIRRARA